MAANVNVQLVGGSIQVVDNAASTVRVNSPIAAIVAQATACFYDAYILIPNGAPLSLVLPAATVWTIYVRNISSANNISIVGTPQGGAAWASPYVLAPVGTFYTSVNYASNPSAGGFSAITLQASAATTYAEVLLAA
jgi:hypothetical protein